MENACRYLTVEHLDADLVFMTPYAHDTEWSLQRQNLHYQTAPAEKCWPTEDDIRSVGFYHPENVLQGLPFDDRTGQATSPPRLSCAESRNVGLDGWSLADHYHVERSVWAANIRGGRHTGTCCLPYCRVSLDVPTDDLKIHRRLRITS
jgi:hypothetical protein